MGLGMGWDWVSYFNFRWDWDGIGIENFVNSMLYYKTIFYYNHKLPALFVAYI